MAFWDFQKQRSETAFVVDDLASKPDVFIGMKIRLEVQLVDGGAGKLNALTTELSSEDATYHFYPPEDGEPLEVKVVFDDAEFSLDSIWAHEKRATTIALKHGFVPDGWGFSTRPDIV